MTLKKNLILAAAFIVFSVIAVKPSNANPSIEALSTCLADYTTGKDRKDLIRWLFLAMAAHPEMRELANSSQESKDSASKQVGLLFTRLLTDNCIAQVKSVSKDDLNKAIGSSFELLGKLAMQEIMMNKEVSASILGIDRYVDRAALDKAFGFR
jgi:hypothetical protein